MARAALVLQVATPLVAQVIAQASSERAVLEEVVQLGATAAEDRRWTYELRDDAGRPVRVKLPTVTQGGVTARPELAFGYDISGRVDVERYRFGDGSTSVTRTVTHDRDRFDSHVGSTVHMGDGQKVRSFSKSTDYAGRTLQIVGPQLVDRAVPGGIALQPSRVSATQGPKPTRHGFTYHDVYDTVIGVSDGSGDPRVALQVDDALRVRGAQVPDPSRPLTSGTISADTTAFSATLDPLGLPDSVSDALGNTALFQRDRLGREVGRTDPTGTETTTTYTARGDVATVSVELDAGRRATTLGGRGCDFTTGVTAEVHTTRIRLDPPVLATKVYVSAPVGGTGVDAFGQAPPDAILNEVAVFEVVSTARRSANSRRLSGVEWWPGTAPGTPVGRDRESSLVLPNDMTSSRPNQRWPERS